MTARRAAPAPGRITIARSAEDLLRAACLEIGFGRALEIRAGQRARIRTAIGG